MGEQPQSDYRSFSFIITNERKYHEWDEKRRVVRGMFGLGQRRISYSKMRDSRKWNAANAFVSAMNSIRGVSTTFLVDKRIVHLFGDLSRYAGQTLGGLAVTSWKPHVLERMARLILAFFTAGLASDEQDIIWITDEDEIVANETRREAASNALLNSLARFAHCQLRGIYVATTAYDTGTLELEDFAAIPDVIGGAVTEALSDKWREGIPLTELVTPPTLRITPRADLLIGELFNPTARLRKLVYAIAPRDLRPVMSEVTIHTDRIRIPLA